MHQRGWIKVDNAQMLIRRNRNRLSRKNNHPRGRQASKGKHYKLPRKNEIPKKALQRYFGFLNYYRNYKPRLSANLVPFFQLLKKDEKVLVTSELIEQFNEIIRDLDRCSQLALRQPLPNRQLVLMTALRQQDMLYSLKTTQTRNSLQSRNPMRLLLMARKLLFLPNSKCRYMRKNFSLYTTLSKNSDIYSGGHPNR